MNAVYAPFDNFQTDAYNINDGRIEKTVYYFIIAERNS